MREECDEAVSVLASFAPGPRGVIGIRTVGRNYVLEHRTSDPEELATLLYKACVKVARRLRKNNLRARGFMLWLGYVREPQDGSRRGWGGPRGWHVRRMYPVAAHRAEQLYGRALSLMSEAPAGQVVASLVITAYALERVRDEQLFLWEGPEVRAERLDEALNAINDRYGELRVMPAAVMASKNPMRDRIPFGTVRYFD